MPESLNEPDSRRLEVPSLTIIIPTYNSEAYLARMLASVAAQHFDGDWDLLVIDNGSSDSSKQIAESYLPLLPRMRVIEEPTRGKAHALNRGIAEAQGDALVLLDADDVVGENYLKSMAIALAHHDLVAARIDVEALNAPAHRLHSSMPAIQKRKYFFLDGVSGCALGVRTTVARGLGGFRADVGVGDDIDFAWRAQLDGYEIEQVNDAVLHYRFRTDPASAFRQGVMYGQSEVRLSRKYALLGARQKTLQSWYRLARRLLGMIRRGRWTPAAHEFGVAIGILSENFREMSREW